jgi:hypothetical protein
VLGEASIFALVIAARSEPAPLLASVVTANAVRSCRRSNDSIPLHAAAAIRRLDTRSFLREMVNLALETNDVVRADMTPPDGMALLWRARNLCASQRIER